MKKITCSFLLIFGSILYTYGQQDPQFSQNMHNKLFVNPAYAGSSGAFCGSLLYRSQWAGYSGDGQPKTGLISLDAPVDVLHGGLGLTLFQDQLGYEKTFGVKLGYAFRFNVGATGKLGIGIDAGYMQKSIDGTKFNPNDPGDPNIPGSVKANVVPDLGAGIYYNNEKLYIGFSSSHLAEGSFDLGVTKYKLSRHYYGTAGYRFDLSPSIGLTPSIFVKNDGATTQLDANVLAHFNEKFWVGEIGRAHV